MNVLIVYAHPEPNSFNATLKDQAVAVLQKQGHQVKISDLYAQHFKPQAEQTDFLETSDPQNFNYMLEQGNAVKNKLFIPEIIAEQEKVTWADLILFQFPIWWFSPPAILKGWFDRVFALDFAWGFSKIYKDGLLAGKKALVSVTTGGPAEAYAKIGMHGRTIEEVLYNVTYGTLYFCGMTVLPLFVSFGVFQVGATGRKKYLQEHKKMLLKI
jgi:NAD(P)H dehydrogenase (quinone)